MSAQTAITLYAVSTWVLPLLIAITFHEASHGYVARLCGDNTAWLLGRVSFNPFRHIDPIGTVLLPALLLLMRSPFLFGYAKPVPINFQALRNPRFNSILVAAAGPAMNLALATLAALSIHFLVYLPDAVVPWIADNLRNAILINVLLAIFNLMPVPPLDGGRIAVGMLPKVMADPLSRTRTLRHHDRGRISFHSAALRRTARDGSQFCLADDRALDRCHHQRNSLAKR